MSDDHDDSSLEEGSTIRMVRFRIGLNEYVKFAIITVQGGEVISLQEIPKFLDNVAEAINYASAIQDATNMPILFLDESSEGTVH